ncbi:hypothetical protein KY290_007589 [Solanum tuberosum]|uniref:Uncharacterized protein n=1 Tax=Solanum tuberosum TaxID=4113 RepID=A0ABQ7W637_SOLTU|nr:hypothetical protein KY290_007589 [Solanum tuberosum]
MQWLKEGDQDTKNFIVISSQGGVPTGYSQSKILMGCNLLRLQRKHVCSAIIQNGNLDLMGMEASSSRTAGHSWRGYYERDTRVLSKWEMLRGVNDTVITLIQKGRHAENVTNYRPIACCNTTYKVISL